jgi:hypothetical protein
VYNVKIFCVAAISRGTGVGNILMTKYSNISWNNHTNSIREYFPAFVNTDVFFETNTCTHAFLYATPTSCGLNMFSMRMKSYIWECVSCPVGKYKNTYTTLYSDCNDCTGSNCQELHGHCNLNNNVLIYPSNTEYTKYFQESIDI